MTEKTNNPLEVLKQYWNYDSFRYPQEETIQSVLKGNDTITFARTGLGKSVLFQVPALCLEGVTVVVSPLKSLQKDQVANLVKVGVPAALLNSDTGVRAKAKILKQLEDKTLKLLYVSPETLFSKNFKPFLELLGKVPLLAVDEAHSCSQWSDFRPLYKEVWKAREEWFPDAVLLAVTATADNRVLEDIVKYLGFGKDKKLFKTSFDRPNITYKISTKPYDHPILKAAQLIKENHPKEAGILFCGTRKKAEETAELLSSLGLKAKPYHSGLKKSEKDLTQEEFLNGTLDIVCATIAFGMGIDHPNITFIIHLAPSTSFGEYVQEVGRAGRSGQEAVAYMLYNKKSYNSAAWLMQKTSTNPERLQIKLKKLREFHDYCTSLTCRRIQILESFGEVYPKDNCNSCDVCLGIKNI